MTNLIYFSNVSENTHRFVGKLLKAQDDADVRFLEQIRSSAQRGLSAEEMMQLRIDHDMKRRIKAARLPLIGETITADEPFVLMTPTYGDGDTKKLVPKQVVKFLNVEANRNLLRGVIGAGNQNFGEAFAKAARIISAKCQVPYLYSFEILGSDEDVLQVEAGLSKFWAMDGSLETTPAG